MQAAAAPAKRAHVAAAIAIGLTMPAVVPNVIDSTLAALVASLMCWLGIMTRDPDVRLCRLERHGVPGRHLDHRGRLREDGPLDRPRFPGPRANLVLQASLLSKGLKAISSL